MVFYSAIKANKIMSFSGKLMELESIMLIKIRQTHKGKYHMFILTCGAQREREEQAQSRMGTSREKEEA